MAEPAARNTNPAGRRSSVTASPVISSCSSTKPCALVAGGASGDAAAMPVSNQMDLDAYTAAHRDEWDELARLGAKRHFTGQEADALIEHYQAGATQLSAIKTTAGQSVQGEQLSVWLSRARLRFTGATSNVLSQVPQFFGAQLPAALYRIRWLSLAVTFGFALVAVLYGIWAVQTPDVLANFGTEEFR